MEEVIDLGLKANIAECRERNPEEISTVVFTSGAINLCLSVDMVIQERRI